MADGSFSLMVRSQIIVRDRGYCQRCGLILFQFDTARDRVLLENVVSDYSLQHRIPRGMGGTKGARALMLGNPVNGVLLCGSGTTGCHGHIESHREEARDNGYSLSLNAPLAMLLSTPVTGFDGRQWLLTEDGSRELVAA
jgi:hypothetical protein